MERQSTSSSFDLCDSILSFPSLTNYSFFQILFYCSALFDLKSHLDRIFFFLYPLSKWLQLFPWGLKHTLAWRPISCKPDLSWDSIPILQQMLHISISVFYRHLIPDISKIWPSIFVFSKAFGTAVFCHSLRKLKYFLWFPSPPPAFLWPFALSPHIKLSIIY